MVSIFSYYRKGNQIQICTRSERTIYISVDGSNHYELENGPIEMEWIKAYNESLCALDGRSYGIRAALQTGHIDVFI